MHVMCARQLLRLLKPCDEVWRHWIVLDPLVTQDDRGHLLFAFASGSVEVQEARFKTALDRVRPSGIRQRQKATVVRRESDHQVSRPKDPLVQGKTDDLLGELPWFKQRIHFEPVNADQVQGMPPTRPLS